MDEYIKQNKFKRIAAGLLMSVFLFGNCTQLNLSPVAVEPQAGEEARLSEEEAFYPRVKRDLGMIDLGNLTTTQGFQVNGADLGDQSGVSVSQAGDINYDGIDDFIIGAYQADPGGKNLAGSSYVIYGKQGGYSTAIDLASLSSLDGFQINGAAFNDESGYSVSQAGDINHDGIDDLIIGAYRASPGRKAEAGSSYVIYGKQGGYNATIDLASLSPLDGFQINGAAAADQSGWSVSQAGDINKDGIDDFIIGAVTASPGGKIGAGSSYVIYGKQGGYNATIDLASLSSLDGFQINGAAVAAYSGISVSQAGDINKDGIGDLIIGAYGAGSSYVIYGKQGGYSTAIDLSSLSSLEGFQINGAAAGDQSGWSVSQAGDINKDGIGDLIIGARGASPGGKAGAGSSYVVYGKQGGYSTAIDLSSLSSSEGFQINGAAAGDKSGYSVSQAGDINKDGIDDFIIGAVTASPGGKNIAGSSYVVYGKQGGYSTVIDLSSLSSSEGFQINGAAAGDYSGISVSQAGDINKDGIDDLIIGAYQADPDGKPVAGSSYVIYGEAPTPTSTTTSSSTTSGGNNFVSPASNLRPTWFSPKRWYENLKLLWSQPEIEGMLTPEAQALVKLQSKCERLGQEAASKTADKWYRFSLEDLQEEVTELLKQPEGITDEVVKQFRARLEGIDKDFLREPLLDKPSFFVGIKNRVAVGGFGINQEGMLLQPSVVPILGAGYVPPAIGN